MNTISKTIGILGVLFLTCVSCTNDEFSEDIQLEENAQLNEIVQDSVQSGLVDPSNTRLILYFYRFFSLFSKKLL